MSEKKYIPWTKAFKADLSFVSTEISAEITKKK